MRRLVISSLTALTFVTGTVSSAPGGTAAPDPVGAVHAGPALQGQGDPDAVYRSCVRDYQGERPISAVFAIPRAWQAWRHDGTGSECFWTRGEEKRRILGVELRPGGSLKSVRREIRRDFDATHIRYRDDVTPYGRRPGERLAFDGTDRGVAIVGTSVQAGGVRLILVTPERKAAVDGFAFTLARQTMLIGHRA